MYASLHGRVWMSSIFCVTNLTAETLTCCGATDNYNLTLAEWCV